MVQMNWNVYIMDIKIVFFQGLEIEWEIFVKLLFEVGCKGVVWQLWKCVYGLFDVFISWYNRVKELFVSCDVIDLKVDLVVFLWENGD